MKTRASRALPILGSALVLAGWTLPALAADAPSDAAQQAAARVAAVEAKLSPEQKQAVASFRAQFDQSQARPQSQPVAGSHLRRTIAGDATLQVAVAKRNADGTLSVSCVDDATQFAAFLAAAQAPAKSEGKEQ